MAPPPEAAAEVLGAAAALRDVRQSPPGYVARRTGRSVPRFWVQMRGGSRVGSGVRYLPGAKSGKLLDVSIES